MAMKEYVKGMRKAAYAAALVLGTAMPYANAQTPTPIPTMPTFDSGHEYELRSYGTSEGSGSGVDGHLFTALLTDKDNPNKVYAITSADTYNQRFGIQGIGISENNGQTWTH